MNWRETEKLIADTVAPRADWDAEDINIPLIKLLDVYRRASHYDQEQICFAIQQATRKIEREASLVSDKHYLDDSDKYGIEENLF